MNATETSLLHFYLISMGPCLYFVVNVMCTLKKCLCLDLFVIVVKIMYMFNLPRNIYFIRHQHILILVQNYGWPTGPAKIWLWLARRPFGWPRATGPAGSTTPAEYDQSSNFSTISGQYL